jgi:transcriptional antiterminator RfaH
MPYALSPKLMNWYAVYTLPRAEKKLHAALVKNGITVYLPLLRTLRQWSDRKKWVEEPLFRSYLFVYVSEKEYFDVLNLPGAVRYVTFEGKAVPVPEKQITAIRYFLDEASPEIFSGDFPLEPGQAVEITRGPLHGLTGELVSLHGRQKVRVRIDALGQFLYLTVSVSNIKAIERG